MNTPFLSALNLDSLAPRTGEPTWLSTVRSEAVTQLLNEGFPTSKTEAWRFTNLRGLLATPFGTKADHQANDEKYRSWADSKIGASGGPCIYVLNGRPLSLPTLPAGLAIQSLSTVLAQAPEGIEPYLAQHARARHFSALNSALFEDGLSIVVQKGHKQSTPLHVVHISVPGMQPSSCFPRLVVVAETNSEISLIETYISHPGSSDDLCTAVTEVCVQSGAQIDHLRIVEGNDTSHHLGTLAIHQERDSRYVSRSIVMGGKLVRLEIDDHMVGPGAECSLEGVYHAIGTEHVAHHTTITHQDSHGTSKEEYRGLIDDRAHAVFDGIIIVDRDTKGTSAHQQNHNLLLSEGATINTKPHLEIDSDDLTASHGATVGAIDPSQLFFLRARGIDEEQARTILTLSFVRSILDQIEPPEIRQHILARLLSRLSYAGDTTELIK